MMYDDCVWCRCLSRLAEGKLLLPEGALRLRQVGRKSFYLKAVSSREACENLWESEICSLFPRFIEWKACQISDLRASLLAIT